MTHSRPPMHCRRSAPARLATTSVVTRRSRGDQRAMSKPTNVDKGVHVDNDYGHFYIGGD
jgi:hypothetical protein